MPGLRHHSSQSGLESCPSATLLSNIPSQLAERWKKQRSTGGVGLRSLSGRRCGLRLGLVVSLTLWASLSTPSSCGLAAELQPTAEAGEWAAWAGRRGAHCMSRPAAAATACLFVLAIIGPTPSPRMLYLMPSPHPADLVHDKLAAPAKGVGVAQKIEGRGTFGFSVTCL